MKFELKEIPESTAIPFANLHYPEGFCGSRWFWVGLFKDDLLVAVSNIDSWANNVAVTWTTAVHQDMRRQGLASELHEHLIPVLKEKGIDHIHCFVLAENTASYLNKQKQGYEVLVTLPKLDGSEGYEHLMRLSI